MSNYLRLQFHWTHISGGTLNVGECDAVLAENENATCEAHTLNRHVYPADKSIVDNDDMTCYLPNTWLNKYVGKLTIN